MPQAFENQNFSPRFYVIASMIVFAVAMRLVIHFVPGVLPYNFTPVESIALFGAAYFTDRRTALIVPLVAMLIADSIIGLHEMIPVIYGCIALTALLGFSLSKKITAARVIGFSVSSSILFFIISNFFVWLTSGMYPLSGTGLMVCFVAAIPFFKTSLFGTLFWSAALFGGFELLKQRYSSLNVRATA